MNVRGFTLIELLVTLALIGLIATLVLPMAELTVRRHKEADLRSALREIRVALDAYKQASDEGRILQRAGESGYPKSLQQLVDGTEDARSPTRSTIRFLRRIPRDPFASPELDADTTWSKRSYKSSATNPQPGTDVYDVHSLSSEKGINGVPYREW